jgi:redox-sensitive bicupin YhaK (pirin superfamily)
MIMTTQTIYKANSRGHADHGWLNSFHSFSFASYNDPDRVHFGALRVLNDDVVAPGMGFGVHPHDNMEIVSIPLRGALEHKDSTGRNEVIRTNDVQIMSAGSGIRHSEFNASKTDDVNFLQVWVFPKKRNIEPRYEQKTFSASDRVNKFQVVVSPEKGEGGVWINQDSWFSLAEIEEGKSIDYKLHKPGNGVYFFVLEGGVELDGQGLEKRDAIAITEQTDIRVKANANTSLLAIEVPLQFN